MGMRVKQSRASKPKVRTGCITCKSVKTVNLLNPLSFIEKLDTNEQVVGFDESNVMKGSQNVIGTMPAVLQRSMAKSYLILILICAAVKAQGENAMAMHCHTRPLQYRNR